MVDFLNIKINRLSDSVVLQHLWNSIDDLVQNGDQPSKANVIDRCKAVYMVGTNEINKNLFLALKEGTISRNVKTDVLSRLEVRRDKTNGDWYCFLCHKVGSDTHCQKCGTSFHKSCNYDLSDQFHCHTCLSIGHFSTDFQKFTQTTQLRIICRVVYVNKIKWRSLNVVGYIEDDFRNNYFIYKIINAIEIDKKLSLGKYFSSDKSKENFLFDLLLLRHNCAVIYGIDHEFSKTITCYIKHLNTEIENIYCESCFLIYSKIPNQKLNSSQKNELFSSVCSERHQLMWGLVPPNVFWPFKLISEDNEKYYGIKFSKSIQFSRQKVESFSKEVSITWSSYSFQICDRPSAELLKAFKLAQIYAKNLSESPKFTDPTNMHPNLCLKKNNDRRIKISKFTKSFNEKVQPLKKTVKKRLKVSKLPKSANEEVQPLKRKLGRPLKIKDGHSLKKKVCHQEINKKIFYDNLSSTESSSGSVIKSSATIINLKKRKRIKDVFISDNEKSSKIQKSSTTNIQNRRKGTFYKTHDCLSSTEYESNYDNDDYDDSERNSDNQSTPRLKSRSCRPNQPSPIPQRMHDKNRNNFRSFLSHKNASYHEENYSSNDTIPQRVSNLNNIVSSDDSEDHEVFSHDEIRSRKKLNHHKSRCNNHPSSKYSAYSSAISQSYNHSPVEFSKKYLKRIYQESNHNQMSSNAKDILINQNQSVNLETGLYCSSSSPVNFSPISNNHQTNVTQVSMQSTPSSNYHLSCDESTYHNGSNLNMKIVLKNRAFQMSNPLQLGINVDPKIQKKSKKVIKSQVIKRNESSTTCKKIIMSDYSESDY